MKRATCERFRALLKKGTLRSGHWAPEELAAPSWCEPEDEGMAISGTEYALADGSLGACAIRELASPVSRASGRCHWQMGRKRPPRTASRCVPHLLRWGLRVTSLGRAFVSRVSQPVRPQELLSGASSGVAAILREDTAVRIRRRYRGAKLDIVLLPHEISAPTGS